MIGGKKKWEDNLWNVLIFLSNKLTFKRIKLKLGKSKYKSPVFNIPANIKYNFENIIKWGHGRTHL